jgi:hypothetical protein
MARNSILRTRNPARVRLVVLDAEVPDDLVSIMLPSETAVEPAERQMFPPSAISRRRQSEEAQCGSLAEIAMAQCSPYQHPVAPAQKLDRIALRRTVSHRKWLREYLPSHHGTVFIQAEHRL